MQVSGVSRNSLGLVHSRSPCLWGRECRREQHPLGCWILLAGIPPQHVSGQQGLQVTFLHCT